MRGVLDKCQLFDGLEEAQRSRLAQIAQRRDLVAGERLFELGSQADRVFVVLEGQMELCLPLSIQGVIREIVIESQGPGTTLGWSAFVKPYRFRLSARAAGPVAVACFERAELLRLIGENPTVGCALLERVAEIISRRLLTVQALWIRELQRSVTDEQAFQSHSRDASR